MTKISPLRWFWILVSFIVALLLTLMPLPTWLSILQPQWVGLFLLYWSIATPECVGIGSAFVLGLCLDVLTHTLLGEHAFALMAVVFFAQKWHQQIRLFPLPQQTLAAGVFTLVYLISLFFIQGLQGIAIQQGWTYWLSAITSPIVWPAVFYILRSYRRKFGNALALIG